MATDRQLEILRLTLAQYVRYGEPVSSATILEKNPGLNISSATIRNEMSELEKEGYIKKLDNSASMGRGSGRVPTTKGYDYYLKTIKNNPDSIASIKNKLDKVLSDRKSDIDNVISEAMKLINESTNTLTITKDSNESEFIVDINSYPVGEEKAIIIIVSSSGKVINNETSLNGMNYSEFSKAVNVLGKRLKNTQISELKNSIDNLGEILSMEMKGIEDKFQDIIKLLVTKVLSTQGNYQGMNNLIVADSIDVKKQVSAIFKMIENNSIWDLISEDGTIANEISGVTVDVDAIDGVSIVQKDINLGDTHKQLTVVGSKYQDYEKLFTLLAYLGEKLGE